MNEDNLNKIEAAIDEIDNRVVTHETTKLDKTTAYGLVKDVDFDEDTGIFTVTKLNGSKLVFDTKLEKLATNWDYDEASQRFIITLNDGKKKYVDVSALVTQVEFEESEMIYFEVMADGKLKARIKNGSITGEMLEPNYLANVTMKAEIAEQKAVEASESANLAENSRFEAHESARVASSAADSARMSTNAASASADDAELSATRAATSAQEAALHASNVENISNEVEVYANNVEAISNEVKTYASDVEAKHRDIFNRGSLIMDIAEQVEDNAKKAQTALNQAGWGAFDIDENGHLQYYMTENNTVDFTLINGRLEAVIE